LVIITFITNSDAKSVHGRWRSPGRARGKNRDRKIGKI
jgi:hypothetical protein